MSTETNIEKLQRLLRDMFQFDCSDLDFGIYRIMNFKRQILEIFISKDLPDAVAAELKRGDLADQSVTTQQLHDTARTIRETLGDDALDGDGNLNPKFADTQIGRKYLELQTRAAGASTRLALEAAIFNHLYTFFNRYYDAGDFLSKRRYSRKEKYAIPYNGEEVLLHWANSDQYYIKTGEYFQDYRFKSSNGITIHFRLRQADVPQNNVKGDKRLFLPLSQEATYDAKAREIIIPFEFRPLTQAEQTRYGQRNPQDAIIAEAQDAVPRRFSPKNHAEALAALTAEHHKTSDGQIISALAHHLRQYTRKNTSDFFVHKDLKGFLGRELDFYLKNEVIHLDELEAAGETRAAGWFQLMRVIRAIGDRIIEFLAQIEDFQKMLFEKRKFITDTQYCITVSNIAEDFYGDIADNDAQWAEWKNLFHIDEEKVDLFTNGKTRKDRRIGFLKAHPTLVLDTRHFDGDFVDRLLASFDDLDEMTDGLLICSENFQALNLLLEKYREKVKCVYIDPPYNTGKDGFLYKDQYQHSSWLSLLCDRLRLAGALIMPGGTVFVSNDDHETHSLHHLMDTVYGGTNFISTFVWNTEGHTDNQFQVKVNHEYIMAYTCNAQNISLGNVVDPNTREASNLWRGIAENSITKNGPGNPPSEVLLPVDFPCTSNDLDLPPTDVPNKFYEEVASIGYITREMTKKYGMAYPIRRDRMVARGGKLVKSCRVYSGWANVNKLRRFIDGGLKPIQEGESQTVFYLSENGVIYYRKEKPQVRNILSVLRKMGTTEQMRYELEHMGLHYTYPKPKELIRHIIAVGSSGSGIVVDFFAGSGTTAHAAIELRRKDESDIRFVLVEMAEYFDTVLLPRIKKVTFSPEWKEGKPVRQATAEETERSPRIVKVIRLESYEDALNNIMFSGASKTLYDFDDYLFQYLLKWETRESATLLNIEKLASPLAYKLRITEGMETREKVVDVPETFAYLLGLHVKTRRVLKDRDRRYVVYEGSIDHRKVSVLWRDSAGWSKADYERDKKFVAEHKLCDGADDVFVNGDSLIPGARSLDGIFKARMFAPVGV